MSKELAINLVLALGLVVVVAVIVTPTQIDALNYTVCAQDKSSSRVVDVKVSDCELIQDVCPFVRGFNKSIELDFVPKRKIDQLKVKIEGKLKSLPVPFHVSPDVACGNYGFDCPLEADKPYKFKMSLPILRSYPKINVDVFLRLVDMNGDIVSCIELPARIQDPQKE